jgi:hypothetical protein
MVRFTLLLMLTSVAQFVYGGMEIDRAIGECRSVFEMTERSLFSMHFSTFSWRNSRKVHKFLVPILCMRFEYESPEYKARLLIVSVNSSPANNFCPKESMFSNHIYNTHFSRVLFFFQFDFVWANMSVMGCRAEE